MGKVKIEIAEKVFSWLMEQPIGKEISLREAFEKVYYDEGYRWVRHESRGWVSSKDDGKTYLIEDMDLFDVLDSVEKKMNAEKRILDFGKWENQCVGVPYNLPFVIREER